MLRECDPARPALGPVGEELVVGEGVLVDQRLGLGGPLDVELKAADHEPVEGEPVRVGSPSRNRCRIDIMVVEVVNDVTFVSGRIGCVGRVFDLGRVCLRP